MSENPTDARAPIAPAGKPPPTEADNKASVQFPWRLHELLTDSTDTSIISWIPGTDMFRVHNKVKFTEEILPAYFNATKYKSFQRNCK